MSPLTIGGVYTARMTGIAGPWTVHGHATLWDVETAPDGTAVLLLEITDAPTPHHVGGSTHHTTYAAGQVTRLPGGGRHLLRPLTPAPGPTCIALGWTLQTRRDPANAAHHTEMAGKILADWAPVPDDGSPLDVSALPHLARAAALAVQLRTVEGERDDLVRRLRAGGVARDLVAQTDGRDPSRITQLCRTTSAGRATVDA
ncbi:hypothetical protein GCM10009639_53790 [Kitasatospora putterlickiae]|uniref:AraC family transcriptional regulator n=1 Tax=Kitasatospora putterlickiae TaxID=221725 RepID=A0ABP4J3E3_9ACTN